MFLEHSRLGLSLAILLASLTTSASSRPPIATSMPSRSRYAVRSAKLLAWLWVMMRGG